MNHLNTFLLILNAFIIYMTFREKLPVVVDAQSLKYLDGTEVDFAREGLNEGFKFNNPNVKDQCGCGESFNV